MRFLLPWRGGVVLLWLLALLSNGCDLLLPLVIGACIDSIDGGIAGLSRNILTLAGLGLLSAIFEYSVGRMNGELSANLERELRSALFAKIVHIPIERAERFSQGDLMSRIYQDVELVSAGLLDAALSIVCSLIVAAGCGTIMLWKSPLLAVVTISSSFLSLWLTGLVSKYLLPRMGAQREAMGLLNAHISESLASFRSSAESDRLDFDCRRMEQRCGAYYQARMRVCLLEGMVEPFLVLLGNVSFLLVVVLGVKLTVEGAITLGAVQALILYLKQFMDPVNSLGESISGLLNVLSGAERIFDILEQEEERDTPSEAPVKTRESGLRFQDVCFGYRRNFPVFQGLELQIEEGRHVAVVGQTGAGKTTLFNLLERFYSEYTGSITLDGCELRTIPLQELRRRITVIPQEPQFLDGTIYENLSYGMDHPALEEVRRAAKETGAARFIESLPLGYDTRVTADSGCFSEGQLQLLCLVRAFLRQSDILLMDEATSSLDTATEANLHDVFMRIQRGRTCITIAHRLSTIVHADCIHVLEDGRIQESGTHSELMRLGGAYYRLFTSQYWGKEI